LLCEACLRRRDGFAVMIAVRVSAVRRIPHLIHSFAVCSCVLIWCSPLFHTAISMCYIHSGIQIRHFLRFRDTN
jgi:hypothetical protein